MTLPLGASTPVLEATELLSGKTSRLTLKVLQQPCHSRSTKPPNQEKAAANASGEKFATSQTSPDGDFRCARARHHRLRRWRNCRHKRHELDNNLYGLDLKTVRPSGKAHRKPFRLRAASDAKAVLQFRVSISIPPRVIIFIWPAMTKNSSPLRALRLAQRWRELGRFRASLPTALITSPCRQVAVGLQARATWVWRFGTKAASLCGRRIGAQSDTLPSWRHRARVPWLWVRGSQQRF